MNVRAFDTLARQEAVAWAHSQLAKAWRTGLVILSPDTLSSGPTWPGGPSMKVPVLREARTFSELTSSRQCPACVTTPLDVTAAKPTTLAVGTSRGIAKVPAWAFSLKECPARSSRRRCTRSRATGGSSP